jgi:hypothetical protein
MARRMTWAETRRFAHKLTGNLIQQYLDAGPELLVHEPDGPKIELALQRILEQHYRFGPKNGDKIPALAVPHETPLLDTLGE